MNGESLTFLFCLRWDSFNEESDMTKFNEKSFTVAVGSEQYRDNYEKVFGKKEPKVTCPLCDTQTLEKRPLTNKTWPYKGQQVTITREVLVPTCTRCNEVFIGRAEAEAIDAACAEVTG